ncbi:hypothetical protein [Actinomyces gaoshouyii]|uniref:Uncharacterized protein n=1 Tax=Actinomyces gaoshouyii TaxID=1960083 RepID=A0A8H9HC98_9ACTO|nr:hypothetical protein [Actinomyces gaoshouyii]GGO95187.1 hypothetical protein GCM10011612_02440 [Actinomyces gaoshouyii]
MPRSSGVAALSASRLLAGPEAHAGLRLLRSDQAAIAVWGGPERTGDPFEGLTQEAL